MTDNENQSKQLRIAIVGCGQIVTHHVAAMAQAHGGEPTTNRDQDSAADQRFQVLPLCDPSPDRRSVLSTLCKAHGLARSPDAAAEDGPGPCPACKEYHSLDDLIRDKAMLDSLDVIFIAVPHDLHEALAVQALEARPDIYVVMEKPLAVTEDALVRLCQRSLDTGRLVVAEQSPYWEEVVACKKLLAEKAIGNTIIAAAAYYYESMRDNITSGGTEDDGVGLGWRGSLARAGGGIAMDGGLHWIRALCELCGGKVTRVVGTTRNNVQPALQMEGESVGHALFEIERTTNNSCFSRSSSSSSDETTTATTQQPIVATYSCNMLATAPMAHDACPYFRITGDAGELIIHGDGLFKDRPGCGGARLYNDEFPMGKELFPSDRTQGFFLGFAGLWQHIYRIVGSKDAAACHDTVVKAANDVRVVLRLYKSAALSQWQATLCV